MIWICLLNSVLKQVNVFLSDIECFSVSATSDSHSLNAPNIPNVWKLKSKMVIEMFASFVDSLSVENVQGYITQG